MVRCMCLVQAGQTPDEKRDVLVEKLKAFSAEAFGEQAEVFWQAITEGDGFTAAEPSTSSIVSVTSPKPLTQEERVPLLRGLCEIWMNETGCSINEVVASIIDPRAR